MVDSSIVTGKGRIRTFFIRRYNWRGNFFKRTYVGDCDEETVVCLRDVTLPAWTFLSGTGTFLKKKYS